MKKQKPNLFIVGMGKAGSTSLYYYLKEHQLNDEDADKAAEIAGSELGLEAEVALHQMQGTTWKTREELLSEDFFGTVDQPGNFAKIMKDTSDFLQNQNSIEESPSQEVFNEYVNPEYIKMSLESMSLENNQNY